MKHVLCVADFTDTSSAAIRTAHDRATTGNAKLTFLYVVPSSEQLAGLVPFDKRSKEQESRRITGVEKKFAARVNQVTGRQSWEFDVVVDCGAPNAIAIETARELDCDFIVTSKYSWTSRMVRHALCPVLVVRTSPLNGAVLSATDLSDPTLPAITAGAEESRFYNRRLIVLTSLDLSGAALLGPEIPPMTYMLSDEQIEAITHDTQSRLREAMRKASANGEPVVSDGRPADGILQAANEFGCSLIVLGTTGRSGLTRLLLGSTAEAVLEQAPCSVLVVRLHAD